MTQPKAVSGKIVQPERVFDGTIVIENGKIADIKEGIDTSADFVYKNHYILPGLIEIHGHFREPGFSEKEDVPHGTSAAIAGGFTTIIDMPNTKPPTVTRELLQEKKETIYNHRSYADYGFFFGVSKDSLSNLQTIPKEEIIGVKLFMAGHETTPTTIPDDATLAKIFEALAKRNILLAVHAEDQDLIKQFEAKFKDQTAPEIWSKVRPKEVVIKAVERALRLAKTYGTKLYLLHLSTPEEFALVKEAKQDGMAVFGELVSYQLLFNTNDYATLGNKIKVAPALRSPEDQAALWELVRNQQIDVLCSEHTPHEFATKNQANVWLAQSGMPNIQETLPGLITEWQTRFGKESLEDFLMILANVSSKNPAQIFNFNQKGELAVGKDADLVVIDPNKPWTVTKDDILSKCGWSAYEGRTLFGRPTATFLRGNIVYENGKVVSDAKGKLQTLA